MKKGARKFKGKFNIRKTIPFKILIGCVILLIALLLIWVGLKISEKEEEKELEGELGTLCIFCSENKVALEVLNYTFLDSLTIDVNINWSNGNISQDDFNTIFIEFSKGDGNCNYTLPTDYPGGFPNFGENKSYQLSYSATNCNSSSNFSDVISVEAHAEVDIHLTQIALIPNMTFYKDSPRQNLINLGRYFFSLVNINYTAVESPNNDKIEISVNNTAKNISISVLDGSWYGTQKFNLIAVSEDGEVLDIISSGENMSFFIIVVDANRPVLNDLPSFNATACDDLDLEINTDYKLDMKKCWYDQNGDTLSGFRYENSSSSNKNLTIAQNSNNLTLIPNSNWVGTGYFYIYASDGKNESQGRIDFEVVNSTVVNNTNLSTTNTTAPPADPKIKSSNPSSAEVYMFPGNKTFSITAEKYSNIKWYLNGVLITGAEDKLSYEFVDLKGGDIVKVDIINGTKIDSKTWNIKIQEDESGEEPVFDVGSVIFYAIIAIICIIILLIVWLFIIEKNKGIKTGVSFGISEPESNVKIIGGRDSNLDSLNIPG
ncbi:MAG: hypothetical protein Q8N63_03925 [Nanoarchaeota archaeon]|nr:hypothetical protein [Nanoarchaeota archaeon]